MTTETVALPEAGTRIRPNGWAPDEWLDVLHAAFDEDGDAKAFGPDHNDFLGCWHLGSGWELVVDENIEKLHALVSNGSFPLHLTTRTRHLIAEYLVANGVTVS